MGHLHRLIITLISNSKTGQVGRHYCGQAKTKLETRAYEAFKDWVVESKLAKDVAEYEQAWKFKLSDNFYLAQQGLVLQYAEYEIGPYVAGLPRLMIPYEQLQGVLKQEYLPHTENAASEIKPAPAAKAK